MVQDALDQAMERISDYAAKGLQRGKLIIRPQDPEVFRTGATT
ncbi:MAG: hypothetical protein QF619_02340 [Candidatus Binatia bacterium]|nr:hypothetical protein [Candidatus Binatia bacterium]